MLLLGLRYFGEKFPNLLEWMQKQINLLVLAEDMLILNEASECRCDNITASVASVSSSNVTEDDGPGAAIYSIALPDGATGVRRLELSQHKLFNGVRDGYAAAYDVMSDSGNGTLRARVLWPDTLLHSNLSTNDSIATRMRRLFPGGKLRRNDGTNCSGPLSRQNNGFLWLSRVQRFQNETFP